MSTFRNVDSKRHSSSRCRGQIFSSDFLLAWFIFLSAMLLAISFFMHLESVSRNQWDSFLLDQKGAQSFSMMVRSPGVPSDWSFDRLPSVVGLSDSPFVLSRYKLDAFSAWFDADQNALKRVMGFSPRQSIRLRVQDQQGTLLFFVGDDSFPALLVSRYSSFGLLDNQWVLIQLEVGS